MSLEADPSHALDDARGRLRAAAICLADFRRESGQAEAAPAGGDIGSVGLTAALRQTRQALEDRSREAESLRQRVAELERRCEEASRRADEPAPPGAQARAQRAEEDSARILRATAEETGALKGRLTLLQSEVVRVESLRRKADEAAQQAEHSKRSLEDVLRRELREANAAVDRASSEAGAREARAQVEVQAVQRRMEAALTRIEMLEREWRVEREKSRAERERLAASLQRAAAVHASLRKELAETNERALRPPP